MRRDGVPALDHKVMETADSGRSQFGADSGKVPDKIFLLQIGEDPASVLDQHIHNGTGGGIVLPAVNVFGAGTDHDIAVQRGRQMDPQAAGFIIRYPYKVIHKELGIKNCRFYDLRGSFATVSLRNGAKIREIADILGHSNVETTENYYISSSNETLKSTIKNFENNVQSDIINNIIKYK